MDTNDDVAALLTSMLTAAIGGIPRVARMGETSRHVFKTILAQDNVRIFLAEVSMETAPLIVAACKDMAEVVAPDNVADSNTTGPRSEQECSLALCGTPCGCKGENPSHPARKGCP
jgi:hypothetical protein